MGQRGYQYDRASLTRIWCERLRQRSTPFATDWTATGHVPTYNAASGWAPIPSWTHNARSLERSEMGSRTTPWPAPPPRPRWRPRSDQQLTVTDGRRLAVPGSTFPLVPTGSPNPTVSRNQRVCSKGLIIEGDGRYSTRSSESSIPARAMLSPHQCRARLAASDLPRYRL